MPSGALIDAFCDQVWLQDGLAASSLASYRRDLTAWAGWLERNGRKHLLAAERGDVDLYLAAQFRAKAKSTSIGRRLSSLRRFYRLQAAQGTIDSDPTLRVRAPKLSRALPKSLSESEVEALLDAPDHDATLGLRDRAMLETLYATGLRVSELVGLKRFGREVAAECEIGAVELQHEPGGDDRVVLVLHRLSDCV